MPKFIKPPSKIALTVALVRDNPGLDAKQLTKVGWRYETHGSLKAPESLGLIEWRDGGWHLVEAAPCETG